MSKFVIACGGTGGHLSPGISVAEQLLDRGHHCWLIISKKQVDARLILNYGHLNFIRAPGSGFSLRPMLFVNFAIQQFKLLIFSFRFLRSIKPDAIIAFGGFMTTGFTISGFILGCPIALHEANRKPGKAVRYLRGLADRLYLPEGVLVTGLPPDAIKHFGLPLRKDINPISKKEARKSLNVEIAGRLLVVFGGSQGAQILNEWVMERAESLAAEGVNIYCVTGLGKGVQSVSEYQLPDGRVIKTYFIPFSDCMSAVLSSADLVVSRAGAGSIAELEHCRAPSILVPFPYAADNHQLANARFLEQHGGCVVLEQSRLATLQEEVLELIYNDWLLAKFRQNLERIERGVCSKKIAQDLENLAVNLLGPQRPRRPKMQMPA